MARQAIDIWMPCANLCVKHSINPEFFGVPPTRWKANLVIGTDASIAARARGSLISSGCLK
jgi:hypothetical protein